MMSPASNIRYVDELASLNKPSLFAARFDNNWFVQFEDMSEPVHVPYTTLKGELCRALINVRQANGLATHIEQQNTVTIRELIGVRIALWANLVIKFRAALETYRTREWPADDHDSRALLQERTQELIDEAISMHIRAVGDMLTISR